MYGSHKQITIDRQFSHFEFSFPNPLRNNRALTCHPIEGREKNQEKPRTIYSSLKPGLYYIIHSLNTLIRWWARLMIQLQHPSGQIFWKCNMKNGLLEKSSAKAGSRISFRESDDFLILFLIFMQFLIEIVYIPGCFSLLYFVGLRECKFYDAKSCHVRLMKCYDHLNNVMKTIK